MGFTPFNIIIILVVFIICVYTVLTTRSEKIKNFYKITYSSIGILILPILFIALLNYFGFFSDKLIMFSFIFFIILMFIVLFICYVNALKNESNIYYWGVLLFIGFLLILLQVWVYGDFYTEITNKELGNLTYKDIDKGLNVTEDKWDFYYFSSLSFIKGGCENIHPFGWSRWVSIIETFFGQITIFGIVLLALAQLLDTSKKKR